jgi:predicted TPR repeat methyltransferase
MNMNTAEQLNIRGIECAKLTQFLQAKEFFLEALKLNHNLFAVWNNLGNVLEELKEYAAAENAYKKAISVNPSYSIAIGNLSMLMCEIGQEDRALQLLLASTKTDANSADIQNQIGQIYLKREQFNDAITAFETAIKIEISHKMANYNLGNVYYGLRQYSRALEAYDNAIIQFPTDSDIFASRAYTLKALNRDNEAKDSMLKALELGFKDVDMAQYWLTAIYDSNNAPSKAPSQYVSKLFDIYSGHFEARLVEGLQYQTPRLLAKQFSASCPRKNLDILDLGCGTGLAGAAFQLLASSIIGVDLSEKMLDIAKTKNCYRELICSDLQLYLDTSRQLFDLIVSADVFVYIGQLNHIFSSVKKSLRPNGWFSFSVEDGSSDTYELKTSLRYGHSVEYCESLARQYDFMVLDKMTTTIRREGDGEIKGHLFLMQSIDRSP